MRAVLLSVVCVLATAVIPRQSEACSGIGCWGGHALPSGGGELPLGASILWELQISAFDQRPAMDGEVTLVDMTDGSTVAVRFAPYTGSIAGRTPSWSFVRPMTPLTVGHAYAMTGLNKCEHPRSLPPSRTDQFVVTAAQPLPTALGRLIVSDRVRGELTIEADGACSERVEAVWVDLRIEYDPTARPYRDAMLYETYVDGELWAPKDNVLSHHAPGASWIGRGTDRLYVQCDGPRVMRVKMIAEAPGQGHGVETPQISVNLNCDGARPPPVDAGFLDVGSNPARDAGNADARTIASGSSQGGLPEVEQSCGCAAVHARRGSGVMWLVLALLILRRRSR